MTDDDSRDRGILTKQDRAYLVGQSPGEMSEASERMKRSRIRSRIYNCILDFDLVFRHLESHDQRPVFEDLRDDEALQNGITAMLGLVYRNTAAFLFDELLEEGVRRGEESLAGENEVREVRVQFDVDVTSRVDVEAAFTKFEEGKPLTEDEAIALLRSERVRGDQAAQLAKQQWS